MTDDSGASASAAASTVGTAPLAASRFTEAVPLSLSSMAHNSIPLEDGLLDGLKTTLQHTLWSSLSYARAAFGQNYSPVDLCTSPLAWTPRAITSTDPNDAIPSRLKNRHGFRHSYQRSALIYLRPAMEDIETKSQNPNDLEKDDGWTEESGALAKITLLYAATAELTPEELEVASYEESEENPPKKKKNDKANTKKRSVDEITKDEDDEGPPPAKHVVLYRATIEYRSLPATGNTAAKKAEELSMLSFGGSLVDDDVKYGALASLYDDHAKYVLEIFGVRGKKYRLDLMDATLSDGTVPTLPSRNPAMGGIATENGNVRAARRGGVKNGLGGGVPIPHDPFVKTLCVTVTDHVPAGSTNTNLDSTKALDGESKDSGEEKKSSSSSNSGSNPSFAITKMRLSLEGDLRIPHLLDVTDLPAPNFYPSQIQKSFLSLRCTKPTSPQTQIVSGMPSGHRLLLDPAEAGKIYIHGRYVTTWGKDPRIGGAMNCTALFGMDLHSVPYWHGRIVDYDKLMVAYATLWTEILTDAKLVTKNIGGRLLSRLITGKDPFLDLEDDEDDDEEDDDEDMDDDDEEEEPRINTDMSCLESQVMASSKCDPVGISAKALATKFQNEYGLEGYPCLAHEMNWVKDRLPGRVPVVVPQRLINVLRRGGFFDIKRTADEAWFAESRAAKPGSDEELVVKRTCELLQAAKCSDVQPTSIVVFGSSQQPVEIEDPVQKKALVRINRLLRQYHVNEAFFGMDLKQLGKGDTMVTEDDEEELEDTEASKQSRIEALALMLGMHIAREHPDGNVMMRYMLKHMVN